MYQITSSLIIPLIGTVWHEIKIEILYKCMLIEWWMEFESYGFCEICGLDNETS